MFVGADAVMLSAETAAGAFPVEAVQMMDRIARQAEAHLWRQEGFESLTRELNDDTHTFGDAIARAMSTMSRDLGVRGSHVLRIRDVGTDDERRAPRRANCGRQ